jgi:hypothetical protein
MSFARLGPKAVNYPPPQGKAPDAVFIDQTRQETAHLYRYSYLFFQRKIHTRTCRLMLLVIAV